MYLTKAITINKKSKLGKFFLKNILPYLDNGKEMEAWMRFQRRYNARFCSYFDQQTKKEQIQMRMRVLGSLIG